MRIKLIIYALLLILLLLGVFADEIPGERKTELYSSGMKKSEGNIINGLKTGYWEYWHENGNISKEGEYTMGKRYGLWIERYEDNVLDETEEFAAQLKSFLAIAGKGTRVNI